MSPRPVITLLTDFGLRDPYVGMMKGVIVGICPDAAVVDITHDVPPQDIRTAALFLERSWAYFPEGTIHVAIVDPGVGTARAPLAIRAAGHYFVGPDNGVLSLAARRPRAVTLTNAALFRSSVSPTFHGRDLFAPVAAHLARGAPFASLGPPARRVVKLPRAAPRRTPRGFEGVIASVDRYGNLITNFTQASWDALRRPVLHAGAFRGAALSASYQAAPPGGLVVVCGGYHLLEIAARDGSAAATLGLCAGDPVRLCDQS